MITSRLGAWEYMNFSCLHTFEVQIFSAIDDLTHCLGIDFERVDVTVVSSDDNVMPLVVMESSVTVAFDYIGPVAEIKHIMYVPKNSKVKVSLMRKWKCQTHIPFQLSQQYYTKSMNDMLIVDNSIITLHFCFL